MNLLSLTENPYQVLGLERDASEAAIKQAYFALVREHSPERDPDGFKRIRAAYEKLRAGGARAQTDLLLVDEPAAALRAEQLQTYGVQWTPLTPEVMAGDLLALEALLLFEDALAGVSA